MLPKHTCTVPRNVPATTAQVKLGNHGGNCQTEPCWTPAVPVPSVKSTSEQAALLNLPIPTMYSPLGVNLHMWQSGGSTARSVVFGSRHSHNFLTCGTY
jgi:hypothetical protein